MNSSSLHRPSFVFKFAGLAIVLAAFAARHAFADFDTLYIAGFAVIALWIMQAQETVQGTGWGWVRGVVHASVLPVNALLLAGVVAGPVVFVKSGTSHFVSTPAKAAKAAGGCGNCGSGGGGGCSSSGGCGADGGCGGGCSGGAAKQAVAKADAAAQPGAGILARSAPMPRPVMLPQLPMAKEGITSASMQPQPSSPAGSARSGPPPLFRQRAGVPVAQGTGPAASQIIEKTQVQSSPERVGQGQLPPVEKVPVQPGS